MARRLAVAACLVATLPAAGIDEVVRRFGRSSVRASVDHARPGGVIVVRMSGAGRGATAVLDGRRAPFFDGRALVPIAFDAPPGARTLGIEIRGRRGIQRVALPVAIGAAPTGGSARLLSATLAATIQSEAAVRDGRRLLYAVRHSAPASRQVGPLVAPVEAPIALGFGAALSYVDAPELGPRFDGYYGEVHRGLDYDVALGTPVRSPGAGEVTLAGPLTLPGLTAVIDHGHGLVSVLCHLSRLEVEVGRAVHPGATIGASGETGIAGTPHLHWAVYLHGVAVDPTLFLKGL